MTRFLYITDTHWGALPGQGWGQQPRDPDRFEELTDGLRNWLVRNPVDFVMHGGDATEHGTATQIEYAATTLASLNVPVYLCLGNHDLAELDSIANWRRLAQNVLPGGRETYVVRQPEFDLYVVSHHWNTLDPPHHWDKGGQVSRFDAVQLAALERHLSHADRPVILVVHAPAADIPAAQTGLAEAIHPPDPDWRTTILGLTQRHAALRVILTAHNHTNTLHMADGCAILSTASLVETPFEARLITVDANAIDIQTLRFGDLLNMRGEYDQDKAWVQGGLAQRTCRLTCS